jgi:parallel beta-helix repeat protein
MRFVRGWASRVVFAVVLVAMGLALPADAALPVQDVVCDGGAFQANLSFRMKRSAWDCALNGIEVQTDGITIDLNGFTLAGPDKTDIGIDLAGRSNVTIRNGVIRGFGTGVNISNGAGNRIIGVDLPLNLIGISVATSNENVLKNNTVVSSGTGSKGIALASADQTIIAGNTVQGVVDPIDLDGTSDSNTVAENHVSDTNGMGVRILGSTGNTVKRNLIERAGYGVGATGTNHVITENRIENGFGESILLGTPTPSSGITITSNIIRGGRFFGMNIQPNHSNTKIIGNTIIGDTIAGISDQGVGTQIKNNRVTNGRVEGIVAVGDNTLIHGNKVLNNDTQGILANGTDGATITNNTVKSNTTGGIQAGGATNLSGSGNVATGNGGTQCNPAFLCE